MTTNKILKNSRLFAGLTEEELAEIGLFAKPFTKNDGEFFFHQGDDGDDIFVVDSGLVELFVRVSLDQESKVAEFKSCDHFGELSIFSGSKRTATAKSKGLTSGVIISGKVFGLIKLIRKAGYVVVMRRLLVGATSSLKGMTNLLTSIKDLPLPSIKGMPEKSIEDIGLDTKRDDKTTVSIENLLRFHLFNGFSPEAMKDVLGTMNLISLNKKDLLFSQDSRGDRCYIVVSGAMQIVVSNTNVPDETTNSKVALIAPGRPLGHLSFFDDSNRSAAAIAAEETKLLEMSKSRFDQLISEGSEIGFLFLFALLDDLVDAMKNTNRRFQFAISQPKSA